MGWLLIALATIVLSMSAAPQEPGSKPGQVRLNQKDGQRYVWILPGKFRMGCSSGVDAGGDAGDDAGGGECYDGERPAREVTIKAGFWLAQTTVTEGTWQKYRLATGASSLPPMDNHGHKLNDARGDPLVPVVGLTWQEAEHLCAWADGRLPTEAEWEYAARAGTTGARYGDLDLIAWFGSNSGNNHFDSKLLWDTDRRNYTRKLVDNDNRPRPVGRKQPNAWNLYDMLGNVWQWTADWYDNSYYVQGENDDPPGPPSGKLRVLRGGSWGEAPRNVNVSIRGRDAPEGRASTFGVRCVWQ
jgi:formylglycine-generating enzyme required for sulfatase activity